MFHNNNNNQLDPYAVLNVRKDATQEEIRKAYLKKARDLHPDKNKGVDTTDKMQELSQANAILSDPGKRKEYDSANTTTKAEQESSVSGKKQQSQSAHQYPAEQAHPYYHQYGFSNYASNGFDARQSQQNNPPYGQPYSSYDQTHQTHQNHPYGRPYASHEQKYDPYGQDGQENSDYQANFSDEFTKHLFLKYAKEIYSDFYHNNDWYSDRRKYTTGNIKVDVWIIALRELNHHLKNLQNGKNVEKATKVVNAILTHYKMKNIPEDDAINYSGFNLYFGFDSIDGKLLSVLSSTQYGQKILLNDTNLRNLIISKIKPVELSKYYGANKFFSSLTTLTATTTGQKIISQDIILRSKITSLGLNNESLSSSFGLELDSLEEFFKNIEGFNILSFFQNDDEPFVRLIHGLSPLLFLTLTQEGQGLLSSDHTLRDMITSQGLNTIVSKEGLYDKKINLSPLTFLTSTQIGMEMLDRDARLRSLIDVKALNAIAPGLGNKSAVYFLASTKLGRQILQKDKRLRNLITTSALNTLVTGEENQSAAICLLNNEDGRQLLEEDQDLRRKIIVKGKPLEYSKLKKYIKHCTFFNAHKVGFQPEQPKSNRFQKFLNRKPK